MNLTGLYQVVILALATASISVTTSKARVFMPVRRWIWYRCKWLGELVQCSYCTTHWVAFGFTAIFHPTLFYSELPSIYYTFTSYLLDLFVSAFVIIALAAIVGGWIKMLNPVEEVE
jgi:hypothetical protein